MGSDVFRTSHRYHFEIQAVSRLTDLTESEISKRITGVTPFELNTTQRISTPNKQDIVQLHYPFSTYIQTSDIRLPLYLSFTVNISCPYNLCFMLDRLTSFLHSFNKKPYHGKYRGIPLIVLLRYIYQCDSLLINILLL